MRTLSITVYPPFRKMSLDDKGDVLVTESQRQQGRRNQHTMSVHQSHRDRSPGKAVAVDKDAAHLSNDPEVAPGDEYGAEVRLL